MKRMLRTFFAFALVLLCLLPVIGTDASAVVSGKCGDDVTWTLDKGTLTLTGSGAMYDYDYDYGNTYDYTKAKTPWAQYTMQITAVKADAAVTHIGNMAFFHCSKLQSAELPGVLSVGSQAFESCTKLQSISLPSAVIIDTQAFHNCSALHTLEAPNVVSIAANSFSSTRIAALSLPAAKSIGYNAFADCKHLTEANLPAAENLGSSAFSGCYSMTAISAPKLKVIPTNAFKGCSALAAANLSAAKSVGTSAFTGCKNLQTLTLPEVTSAGAEAFAECHGLKTISMPKLTTVKKDVFKNCINLTEVSFSEATALERYAFRGCTALAHISMPALIAVPEHAFELLTSLRTVNMPSVTILGQYAFNGCKSLQSIYLPSLTEMQMHAFRHCTGLTEATLPNLKVIANSGFYGCKSLQTINAPLVTHVNDFAFQECSALKVIDFPDLMYIGNCGFYLCTSLAEAYIPAVIYIDLNGFNSCRSLYILSISYNLETVNARAFEGCSALKSVYVSKTKPEWTPLTVNKLNNDYFLNAQILYDVPPFVVDPMPDQISVAKGFSAEVIVTAHGRGLSYQWQVCLPGTNSWSNITSATSAKLYYGPVSMSDTGTKLRCVVTNRDNDTLTSEVVELVVTPFADVAADAFYYPALLWALDANITTGTSATTFSPDGGCTRGQVVTFLWRKAGQPAPTTDTMPFTDVAAGSYYYDAVLWAVEQGITTGISATTFSPDTTCTRGQVVTFLHRAAGKPASAAGNPFTDVADDSYYYDAVVWAVDESITQGISATAFSPDATCTRGQVVTFLYRAR